DPRTSVCRLRNRRALPPRARRRAARGVARRPTIRQHCDRRAEPAGGGDRAVLGLAVRDGDDRLRSPRHRDALRRRLPARRVGGHRRPARALNASLAPRHALFVSSLTASFAVEPELSCWGGFSSSSETPFLKLRMPSPSPLPMSASRPAPK